MQRECVTNAENEAHKKKFNSSTEDKLKEELKKVIADCHATLDRACEAAMGMDWNDLRQLKLLIESLKEYSIEEIGDLIEDGVLVE